MRTKRAIKQSEHISTQIKEWPSILELDFITFLHTVRWKQDVMVADAKSQGLSLEKVLLESKGADVSTGENYKYKLVFVVSSTLNRVKDRI